MKGLRTSEGRVLSDETKKKISATSKGRELSAESRAKIGASHANSTWINNGKENRKVLEEDLEWYLSRGYKIGIDKSSPSPHGSLKRIWITNGVRNKSEVNYCWAEDPAASCFNGSLKESPQAFDPASP